ncbi:MAG: thioredoxin [Blastocatellia bacterium]
MEDPKLIRCPSCGASNRVEPHKIGAGAAPVCGKCKTSLSLNPGPVHITDANFASEVERSALPVLLDLWAPWCPPCRVIAPIIEQLAGELSGKVKVGKLNTDENQITGSKFGVRSIPTLLIFKDGREVDRLIGSVPKSTILDHLRPIM